jgi:hypothetical protein
MQADDRVDALQALCAYVIHSMSELVQVIGETRSSPTRGCLATKIATNETTMEEPGRRRCAA